MVESTKNRQFSKNLFKSDIFSNFAEQLKNNFVMKTIRVQLSDVEYNAFGLSKDTFNFSEIANLIERQVARQALRRSVELAEKSGLSTMTMSEINAEINASRQCRA